MSKTKKPANVGNEEAKDVEGVITRNQELEGELKKLEDQLKRALADYQNLERRMDDERKLLGQLSAEILIEKLLPILDNLENAQSHLNDRGLEMVLKQFREVLAREGVEEIDSEGRDFDPNLHEAIEVTDGENNGRIVKVARKGYKINNKVLRPSQVVVEGKKENDMKDAIINEQNNERN